MGAPVKRKAWIFFHKNSALPTIFFKNLHKARISKIFQIQAIRKIALVQLSFFPKSQIRAKP
jgi:hypothetical protein